MRHIHFALVCGICLPVKGRNMLSTNLRRILKSRGIAGKEFAEGLNVYPATVSQWLTGKSVPSTKNIRKIAKYLDISIEELTEEGTSLPETYSEFRSVLIKNDICMDDIIEAVNRSRK